MNRFLDPSARMDTPVHFMLFLLFALELSMGAASVPLVTLEELRSLNASCGGMDTCRGRLRGDDNMQNVNCQCGPYCVRYGTCCMDAPDILKGKVMEGYGKGLDCSFMNGPTTAVHLVEKCPKEWDGDDSVRDLCVADAEENSDIMLLVPVSSLKTGITYRNYFCYVCNTVDELNDSSISWNVKLSSYESFSVDLSTLTYVSQRYAWTYPGAPKDLFLQIVPPAKLLEKFSIFCRYGVVISSCAVDWTDEATRTKCGFYTALVGMMNGEGYWDTYRNVHCGICNGASSVQCNYGRGGYGGQRNGGAAKVFQEIFLISEVPEKQCKEGQLYDKVTKNCRNFRCGKKMVAEKGRCVRKE